MAVRARQSFQLFRKKKLFRNNLFLGNNRTLYLISIIES